ncbi:MAG: MFS transporter [Candidatus Planktophila sp.]|jgi:MFS family permease|nr:MFS transporter [Candidatus Planktophila sp.]
MITTQLRELSVFKGFLPLISARFISNVGNGLAPIALAYGVLGLDGSDAKDLSLVMSANIFPMIALMLFGGVIGDRFKRNRIVGGTDMLGSVFVAVSAASFLLGFASVPLLVVMGFLFGVLNAMWWPAMLGVLPAVVPKEKLNDGNAVLGLLSNFGFVLGALLGGTLVTLFGSGWALLVDALSFFIAGVLVWRLDVGTAEPHLRTSIFSELRDGWFEFKSRTWLVAMVIAFTGINASFEALIQILGPLAFNEALNAPRNWSFNLAGLTLGMICGGFIALKIHFNRPMFFAMIITAISTVWEFSLAMRAPLLLTILTAFLAGVAVEIYTVNWRTTMQTHIPEESFSRVNAYDAFGSYALAPMGIVIAGPLAMYFGVHRVILVAGVITLSCALLVLLVRSVRELKVIGSAP